MLEEVLVWVVLGLMRGFNDCCFNDCWGLMRKFNDCCKLPGVCKEL